MRRYTAGDWTGLKMPTTSRIVTLLTDFGQQDHYVAAMKGVMLSINANLRLVDITHQIPPQDIRSAAFTLGQAYHYFPAETIHVAVVDPGVGSPRKALVARAGEHFFVAPDNGILSYVLEREEEHPRGRRGSLLSQAGLAHVPRAGHLRAGRRLAQPRNRSGPVRPSLRAAGAARDTEAGEGR